MVAAQDDSSDEDEAKPVITKPQENLDDFLDDFSTQTGDYEALWNQCASISNLPESVFVFVGPSDWYILLTVTFAISRFIFFRWPIKSKWWSNQPCEQCVHTEMMKWGFCESLPLQICSQRTTIKRSKRGENIWEVKDEDQRENADKLRQFFCALWQRGLAAKKRRGENHSQVDV